MILFLLLLIVAAGVVAIYAGSGNTGTHDVTLWQWHWSAVPDWVPVVLTAVVFGGLLLLYMIYSGLVHGVRVGSMGRRVTTRESALNELRRENRRLREENARVRSATGVPDRSRSLAAYRPPTSFGDRMRVSRREPAGY